MTVERAGAVGLSFSNGNCVATSSSVTVNVGTLVLGDSAAIKASTVYFGLSVGRLGASGPAALDASTDGTYPGVLVLNDHGSVVSVPVASVVLHAHRTVGEFAGQTATGVIVKGAFTCPA